MMRKRLAPSAVRTAISFCLAVARARRRFATLAQAISNTIATAPNNTNSDVRRPLTNCSRKFVTRVDQPVFVSM
jgi:hypothetical protein